MVRIDFNRLRFLVIDDNAHMRRILRTLLHSFGTREVFSGLRSFCLGLSLIDSSPRIGSFPLRPRSGILRGSRL